MDEKREENLKKIFFQMLEERNVKEWKKKFLNLLKSMNGTMEEVTRDGETTLYVYLDDRNDYEISGDWDNDLDRIKAGIEYLELVRLEDLEVLENELAIIGGKK